MSDRVYHQRMHMMARIAKGGYMHVYEIADGDKVIGTKTIHAPTRSTPATITYALGNERFNTAKEFIAAYEAKLGEAA